MAKVTIGIPTYNSENTIVDLLESIRIQSFTDFCVFVSDNNSNDSTCDIVNQYASFDNRFKLFKNSENMGSVNNLIRLIDLSESQYFSWLPSDVVLANTYLEKIVKSLDSNNQFVGCYSNSFFKRDDKIKTHDENYELISDSIYKRICTLIEMISFGTAVYGVFRIKVMKEVFITPRSGINPWVDNKVFQFGDIIMLSSILAYGKINRLDERLVTRFLDDNQINEQNYWLNYFDKIERYQALNLPVLSLPFLMGIVKLKKVITDANIPVLDKYKINECIDKSLVSKYKKEIIFEIDYMTISIRKSIINSFSQWGKQHLQNMCSCENDSNLLKVIILDKIMFETLSLVVYIKDQEILQQIKKMNNFIHSLRSKLND